VVIVDKGIMPRYTLVIISVATGDHFSDKKRVLANVSAAGV
jgi:hypothetical protein